MRIIISEVIPAEARAELNLDEESRDAYVLEFVNGLQSMSMVFACDAECDNYEKIVAVARKFQGFFKTLTDEVEIHDCVVGE